MPAPSTSSKLASFGKVLGHRRDSGKAELLGIDQPGKLRDECLALAGECIADQKLGGVDARCNPGRLGAGLLAKLRTDLPGKPLHRGPGLGHVKFTCQVEHLSCRLVGHRRFDSFAPPARRPSR